MAIREATVENGKLLGAPSGIPSTTVFRGIPYAASPVGELRWKAPAPAANWEGVRLAHTFGPTAIQPDTSGVGESKDMFSYPEPMSEDCLYLNIWTPARKADEKLPVMFWIHGGAYFAGYGYASQFDGDGLASRGVILVSINYRLGVYGFMCHPDLALEGPGGACGNYGIIDQIAALKWVRRNIAAFGGDPDNITIFGQSAGSGSVQTLVSSPLTKGLIKRAIMQSGVAMDKLDFIAPCPQAELEEFGSKLLAEMGLESIAEARKLDALEFYNKSQAAQAKVSGRFGLFYRPIIDGYVLETSQVKAALEGRHPDIDYIVGHTEEILLDMPGMPMERYKAWLKKFGENSEYVEKLFNIDSQEKLDELRPGSIRTNLIAASHAWCRNNIKLGHNQNSYYFYFDRKLPGDSLGAFHSAELWYVFNTMHRAWRPWTQADLELSQIMCSYWANFAKTGNPNSEGLPKWNAYTAENHAVMMLDERARCVNENLHPGIEYLVKDCLGEK